jgi:hypothetical protein
MHPPVVTIATMNVGNYRGMGARYVNALYRGCLRNLTIPFRFVCFTDESAGLSREVETKSLPSDLIPERLHKVYNKIALFRPGAFSVGERVLFMDLDTIILSNIDDLAAYHGPFAMLRDPTRPHALGSGLMAWEFTSDLHEIWERWVAANYPDHPWADQGWIAYVLNEKPVRLQDAFPDRILSFNVDCCGIPPKKPTPIQELARQLKYKLFSVPYPRGASVVYFQGEPKPDNCRRVRWVQRAWQ